MKKIFLGAVVGMVLFTSCKKDWNCICTSGSTSGSAAKYTDVTKKEAKEACNSVESLGKVFDSGFNCDIEKD